MNIGELYNKTKNENFKLIKRNKELEKQHQDDLDIIGALTTENLELGKINKDLLARFDKGGYIITKNNGYVTSIVKMQPYSQYLPLQELSSNEWVWCLAQVDTPLYAKIPFIQEKDRQLVINETNKNKYKGVL